MRAIRVLVTADSMARALKLPAAFDVFYAGNWDFQSRTVELVITHPELPEVEPWSPIPEGVAVYDSRKGIATIAIVDFIGPGDE